MTKAKVVRRKGKASLVETEDGEMLIVPAEPIDTATAGDMVDMSPEMLDQAIPYGVPFASMLNTITIHPHEIEEALHNYGIWTMEDFDGRSDSVHQALQSVIGITYHKIYQSVHSFAKENLK